MTPCRPKHPAEQGSDCRRHDRAMPHDAERRPMTLLLDVRAILPDGAACPLFVSVPQPRYWWEPTDNRQISPCGVGA